MGFYRFSFSLHKIIDLWEDTYICPLHPKKAPQNLRHSLLFMIPIACIFMQVRHHINTTV